MWLTSVVPALGSVVWALTLGVAGECPSPAAVAAAMRAEVAVAGDLAEVQHQGPQLVLRWRDPSGAVLAEQRLPAQGDCAGLARTVAVIFDIWSARFEGPRIAAATAETRRVVVARPEAAGRPASQAGGEAARLGVAGWGSADSSGGTPALGLTFDLRWFAAELVLEGQHAMAVGPGSGRWQRLALQLGGAWVVPFSRPRWPETASEPPRWEWSFRAAAIGSLVLLSGQGFTVDQTAPIFDAGLVGGTRVARALGRRRAAWVWLEASMVAWPARQPLEVGGLGAPAALPLWEGLFGAGLSFDLGQL